MTVWMTASEAAEYAGVSIELVRIQVRIGDLPAYKIGSKRQSHYRVTAEDVDKWLEDRPWEKDPAYIYFY